MGSKVKSEAQTRSISQTTTTLNCGYSATWLSELSTQSKKPDSSRSTIFYFLTYQLFSTELTDNRMIRIVDNTPMLTLICIINFSVMLSAAKHKATKLIQVPVKMLTFSFRYLIVFICYTLKHIHKTIHICTSPFSFYIGNSSSMFCNYLRLIKNKLSLSEKNILNRLNRVESPGQ